MTQKSQTKSSASSVVVMGARRRTLAFVIDGGLVAFLVWLLPFTQFNGENLPDSLSAWMSSTLWLPDLGRVLLAWASLSFLVGVAAEVVFGWTLGKRLLGGKVLSRRGEPLGWFRAVVRNVLKVVSLSVLGLGQLWAFFDKDRRSMYDRFCGTMVIQGKRPGRTKAKDS